MSKKLQVILDESPSKTSKKETFSKSFYDQAISDAENRIKELKKAVSMFKGLREKAPCV